jgi:hypothetical protein
MQIWADAFTTAQLGDGLFASESFENNAYFLFRGIFAAGLAIDLSND